MLAEDRGSLQALVGIGADMAAEAVDTEDLAGIVEDHS